MTTTPTDLDARVREVESLPVNTFCHDKAVLLLFYELLGDWRRLVEVSDQLSMGLHVRDTQLAAANARLAELESSNARLQEWLAKPVCPVCGKTCNGSHPIASNRLDNDKLLALSAKCPPPQSFYDEPETPTTIPNKPLTDAEVAALRELASKATSGPCFATNYSYAPKQVKGVGNPDQELYVVSPGDLATNEDAEFIAACYTIANRLAAEWQGMRAEVKRLEGKVRVLTIENSYRKTVD